MWNHRIIKKKNNQTTTYEIHEVYYDDSGAVEGWTKDAVSPFGESLDELKADLKYFLHSFKSPILELVLKDGKEILTEEATPSDIDIVHSSELIEREIIKSILERLTEIENENGVEILYAVESGSRAWGFESPDSDYDVRFIYRHKPEWYISVMPKRDVIEYPVSELLDFSGWDISKALFLLNKSNPVLFEWLNSPIVYRSNESALEQFRSASELYFSPKSCIYHYLHMAKGNFREYLQKDLVRVKKYFYVLRPLCACMWIEKHDEAPPMNFESLLQGLSLEAELLESIDKLLIQKRKGLESETADKITVINDFIEKKIDYFSEKASAFNAAEKPRTDKLDQLLRTLIRRPRKGCIF